jgi:hypothetical protein
MDVLGRVRRGRRRISAAAARAAAVAVSVAFVAGVSTACAAPLPLAGAAYGSPTAAAGGKDSPRQLPIVLTHAPSSAASVLADAAPDVLTAEFAKALFVTSPVVVVAAEGGPTLAAAVLADQAAHAPLLVALKITPQLVAAVSGLRPRAVLLVGLPRAVLAARLPGIQVVSRAAQLPLTGVPAPLSRVAVLVGVGRNDPAISAVETTAGTAGATVVGVQSGDPRADPSAIEALARLRPREVIGVGSEFGPASRLGSRVAVAMTGRQLPGGGQVLFPGRRLVALYGYPGTPGLGVLGQQDLTASVARAEQMAAAYRPLSSVPVVPAFEIIATVAEAKPGADGNYSYESPVSSLQPWVSQAAAAGMYVVLDLQPGRASLLAQAELYQSLLQLPNVGLAIDAEWKLQPGQKPLRQIGHVDIGEVNSVVHWLAALTARYQLPQKLLVLHQFRLSMINGEQDLDTSRDDLAIVVHMDGQGTPGAKQETWNAVTGAAPHGVFFGWKNFLVKDHPMLTPQQTMMNTPLPVMISYQ